jgi:hypothetical protein
MKLSRDGREGFPSDNAGPLGGDLDVDEFPFCDSAGLNEESG